MVDFGWAVDCCCTACAVIIMGVPQYPSLSSFHKVLPYLIWITLPRPSFLFMDLPSGVLFILIFWLLLSSPFVWVLPCSLHTVWWSCVVLLLCSTLSMLLILLVAVGCFSSCVRMFSNGSVLVCFCSCSRRYCSADISVGFICCLSHVTNLPVFVMWVFSGTVLVCLFFDTFIL